MGNKMNDIDIVYTMWTNLKKTAGMEVKKLKIYKKILNIDKAIFIIKTFSHCS